MVLPPSEQVPVGKHVGGVLKTRLKVMTNLFFFIFAVFTTVYVVSVDDCTVTCFD